MRKVNLGIIGMGSIGRLHLKNSLLLRTANVRSVCDLSRNSLRYAKMLGVKNLYTDSIEMLKDKDLDGVIISLPTYLHKETVLQAAEAGKDILLEKPLARNEEEGREMLRVVQRHKVRAMVGYPLRFMQSFLDLKEKINSGVIGEVQTANAINIGSGPLFHRSVENRPHPVPTWYFEKDLAGGGALLDLGVHLVNLLRWYFGDIADARSCLGYRFGLEVEDHAVCFAKFKNGLVSAINVGWFSSHPHLAIELFGTINHELAHPDLPTKGLVSFGERLLRRDLHARDAYFREIGHFVSRVERDLEPFPTMQDAMKDLETISLAYKNRILIRSSS